MYLIQKNQVRGLDKSEFLALTELCRLSKNLYNVGLYTVRQYFSGALCERYGLVYTEQEESYTSKASALDGDDLPVYNADKPATYQFYGKRVKCRLYRTWEGHLINADCNGAANIGRKSKQNGFTGLSRGSLTAPRRINLLKPLKW